MTVIPLNIDTPTNQVYTINGAIRVDKCGRVVTRGRVSGVGCDISNNLINLRIFDARVDWVFDLTPKDAEILAYKILGMAAAIEKAGE